MKQLLTGAGGFVAPYAAQAFAARVAGVGIVASSHRGGPASGFEQTLALDVADPDAAWRINVPGALTLGRAILRASPQTILLNAGSAYGDSANRFEALDEEAAFAPADEYGATKAAADLGLGAMTKRGLKLVRLRPFNHTGPGQNEDYVAPAFAAQIAAIEVGERAPVLKVGNLEAERDFCNVRDVSDAYALAAIAASEGRIAPGRAFNLCSGRAVKMRALLDMLLKMARVEVRIEQDPARMRGSDIPRIAGDPRRAEAELGWRAAIPLETTLADLLAHERARIRVRER